MPNLGGVLCKLLFLPKDMEVSHDKIKRVYEYRVLSHL